MSDLKAWWAFGLAIEYILNATKSVIIVKPEHYVNVIEGSIGKGVIVIKGGQRHLGAVIRTKMYKEYVGDEVIYWVKEIEVLSAMAKTEP